MRFHDRLSTTPVLASADCAPESRRRGALGPGRASMLAGIVLLAIHAAGCAETRAIAVRVRPSSRLISDDFPTLERPANATCGIPSAVSGCACPTWPMAPANSTDFILMPTKIDETKKPATTRAVAGCSL